MPALERPVYWSPAFVLEEVREGRRVAELITQAQRDRPEDEGGATAAAYRNDIKRWTDEDPAWAEDYRSAMREAIEHYDRLTENAGRPVEFDERLQLAFFREMAGNGGDLSQAAYDVGIAPGTVLTMLNPKSPRFNEDFAERYFDLEGHRLAKLHDAVWEEGLVKGPDGRRNTIILKMLAESRLPEMFNAKRVVEVAGTVRHEVEVIPAEVTRQLAQQRKALEPGEGPVINVTGKLLPEKVEARR